MDIMILLTEIPSLYYDTVTWTPIHNAFWVFVLPDMIFHNFLMLNHC